MYAIVNEFPVVKIIFEQTLNQACNIIGRRKFPNHFVNHLSRSLVLDF